MSISIQPKAQITDQLLTDKLNAVSKYKITQGGVALEALTGGAWPNSYIISDMTREVNVTGRSENVPIPLFMVKEESNCCARICCPGNQSLLAKVIHADPQPVAGASACGCYSGHVYKPNLALPAAMTLQRAGCCGKWLGCFVCSEMCQNDMHMHAGDVQINPSANPMESPTYFGRSLVPKGGGGFTPTINLYSTGSDAAWGVVEGPTCYSGWLGVCTNTIFTISSTPGGSGDIGIIKKNKAKTFGEMCVQLCTNVDQYEFIVGEKFASLTTEQKATILGNIIHIEYIFFENDAPPCYSRRNNDNSTTCYCTLCQMFCYGCSCPIQICCRIGQGE